jgi:hypothetical protein
VLCPDIWQWWKLLLAMVETTAAAVRDVIVNPLFRHGRVVELLSRNGAGGGSFRNQNQASPCPTTLDLDCDVVFDGESESWKPRESWDNFNSKVSELKLNLFNMHTCKIVY